MMSLILHATKEYCEIDHKLTHAVFSATGLLLDDVLKCEGGVDSSAVVQVRFLFVDQIHFVPSSTC